MLIRDDSALVQIEETVVHAKIKNLLLTLASIGMAGMATGQVPPPTNIEKLKQMKVATTDLNIPVVPQAGPNLDPETRQYRGRPVDVANLPDGSILVSDATLPVPSTGSATPASKAVAPHLAWLTRSAAPS